MLRSIALSGVVALGLLCGTAQAASPQGEANKALVLEFYRQVFEPQDVSKASAFIAPDMIEHNPTVGQGLAGFVAGFGPRWKPRPVEAKLRGPPAITLTDGDFVQLVFQRQRPEPADPAKTYTSYWFDLFRLKDGKIVEHWDGALKPTK